jgi:hypothetical protein
VLRPARAPRTLALAAAVALLAAGRGAGRRGLLVRPAGRSPRAELEHADAVFSGRVVEVEPE